MRIGIELEVASITSEDARRALRNAGITVGQVATTHQVLTGAWKVVTDGSIRPFGCEVVSPPLEFNSSAVAEITTVVTALRNAGATVNKTTGFHVHVEMINESSETLANTYNRYRAFERQIDLFHAPSRRGNTNTYCMSLPEYQSTSSRYLKVNLQSFVKYGTLEFRQHAGSLNATKVCNWIQFVTEFVMASRVEVGPPSTTVNATGKSNSIASLIADRPMTAEEIATMLNSNVLSVQSMICRLKKAGTVIDKIGKKYVVRTFNGTPDAQVVDTWSRGVSASVVNHLQTRNSA
jgi:biotin operon repressor